MKLFTLVTKQKKKHKKNGFIAENEGSASKFYNLILFDVEKEELKRLKTNFDVYYWPSTKNSKFAKQRLLES